MDCAVRQNRNTLITSLPLRTAGRLGKIFRCSDKGGKELEELPLSKVSASKKALAF